MRLLQVNTQQIVNVVKTRYESEDFNPGRPVKIRLIGQITFITGDPYSIDEDSNGEVSVDELLSKFHNWGSQPSNTPAHDNRQVNFRLPISP